MSKDTRTAGLSFLLAAIIVATVSMSARYFYDDSKATAAALNGPGSIETIACE